MIIKFDKNLFGTEDDTAAAHFTNGGNLRVSLIILVVFIINKIS